MKLALVILFDTLDRGNLARQRQVEDVAALSREQPDAGTSPDLDSTYRETFHGILVFEQLPLPLVHFESSTGRNPRSAPWSFMKCSCGSISVLSRMRRARSSPLRTSAFSSSVKVMMRSVSISSISVPSKRSPGLSGAISG